jgi:hypothetical protein
MTRQARLVAGVLACTILALLVFALFIEPLDHDEFQHLFLAWNTAQGEQLYVDTFDTHGPLYTLINAFFFAVTGPPSGPGVYTLFRAGSLLALMGIASLVFRVARDVTGNLQTSTLASLLFLTLVPIMNKGIEIRPDVLQNLLWMMCVGLIATDLGASNRGRYGLAGVLLGLAGMTNTKAVLGAAALGCFFITQLALDPSRRRERLTTYIHLAIGALVSCLALVIPFVMWGTAAEAIAYSVTVPFYLATHHDKGPMPSLLPVLTTVHSVFSLSACAGLYLLLKGKAGVSNTHARYIFVLALVTTIGSLKVGHAQILLISLPLVSVVAAVGVQWCLARLSSDVVRLCVVLAIIVPAPAQYIRALGTDFDKRKAQDELLVHTLSHLSRDDQIGVFWNDCGGYSFNPPSRFLWMGNYSAWLAEQMYRHGHGNRQQFEEQERVHLEDGPFEMVIGRMNSFHYRELGAGPEHYLQEHFTQSHNACLWTRKLERADED